MNYTQFPLCLWCSFWTLVLYQFLKVGGGERWKQGNTNEKDPNWVNPRSDRVREGRSKWKRRDHPKGICVVPKLKRERGEEAEGSISNFSAELTVDAFPIRLGQNTKVWIGVYPCLPLCLSSVRLSPSFHLCPPADLDQLHVVIYVTYCISNQRYWPKTYQIPTYQVWPKD